MPNTSIEMVRVGFLEELCWIILTRDSDHDVSDYIRRRNGEFKGITVGVEAADEAYIMIELA